MTARDHVTLEIARADGRRSRHVVPVAGAHMRVLDLLLHVRNHADATLGFRYACRVGMCGVCAVRVNGTEGLACQVAVGDLGVDTVTVEPLAGLPVQHDLMVDLAPVLNDLAAIGAALEGGDAAGAESLRTLPPSAGERPAIERQNGCITCGACTSAAHRGGGAAGPGPAALNRALMLALDERDAKGRKRLANLPAMTLSDAALKSLDAVCPVGIPLAAAVRRLQGLRAGAGG
ncbi:MAG: succinate dehydrogenase/fumarate reductase iron-sulfur subunit [Alphaproteobacteria bacterium]|nr:succinate dehydrogenase/fumarate reductase iron-sulfur subunit [Alphaproteobacteria bacterium]